MHSDEFLRGWLQGFYDGEGGAYLHRYGKAQRVTCKILVGNTDSALIEFACVALAQLGIEHRRYDVKNRATKSGRYRVISVHKRDAMLRFIALVGFVSPAKRLRCDAITAWVNRAMRRRTDAATGRFTGGKMLVP